MDGLNLDVDLDLDPDGESGDVDFDTDLDLVDAIPWGLELSWLLNSVDNSANCRNFIANSNKMLGHIRLLIGLAMSAQR